MVVHRAGPGTRAALLLPGGRRVRRVLDERDDPAGHEPGGTHQRARPGDLVHLDHAPHGAHLDLPPGPRGAYLVGLRAVSGIDHDLDAVPLHGTSPRTERTFYDIPHTAPPKLPSLSAAARERPACMEVTLVSLWQHQSHIHAAGGSPLGHALPGGPGKRTG